MHHSEPPLGEAAHNAIPKKQMECAPQQPSSFVRLSQVFPRVPQVGSAPVHGNLDDDESIDSRVQYTTQGLLLRSGEFSTEWSWQTTATSASPTTSSEMSWSRFRHHQTRLPQVNST